MLCHYTYSTYSLQIVVGCFINIEDIRGEEKESAKEEEGEEGQVH